MSNQPDTGIIFVGGLIVGSLIMAAGYGISFDPQLWLNEAGLAEIAIGLLTLLALIFGGWQANKSFWLSRSAAHSTRFADAARLLDGDDATLHAGIALTREIALEDPKIYGLAAIRSLLAVARRTTRHLMQYVDINDDNRIAVTLRKKIPASPAIAVEAFLAACKLFARNDFDKDELPGQLHVQEIFFSTYALIGATFGNVAISRAVFYRTNFSRCTFKSADIVACFAGRVIFQQCNVSGLRISGTDRNGNELQPDSLYAPYFHDCTGIETATINGVPVSEYVAARRSNLGQEHQPEHGV